MGPEKKSQPDIERPKTVEDRREFLRKAGTFAVVTPAAVTFLLSTSMSSRAIAASAGRGRSFDSSGAAAGAIAAGAGVAGVAAAGSPEEQAAKAQQAPAQPLAPQPVTPIAPAPPPAPAEAFMAGERG